MSEAHKLDDGKPAVQLIPPVAILEEARVMGFGASKYGPYDWTKGRGLEYSRLIGAAMRHILAWHGGEDVDQESGLNHLAHARCCLGMLMAYQKSGRGKDDRYLFAVNDGSDETGADSDNQNNGND